MKKGRVGRPKLKFTKALKKRIKILYLRGISRMDMAKRVKLSYPKMMKSLKKRRLKVTS